MSKWINNNLGLKIVSLVLAVITWFYISGELKTKQNRYYPRAPVMQKP
ncbi:MAG: hypothetical protein JW869_05835 [Candidatus Omnitrophica bacterium]|nr:hypothetical protein [Candidatus Omnitrophota bacterium]